MLICILQNTNIFEYPMLSIFEFNKIWAAIYLLLVLGIALEGNIGKWWVNQNHKVAHGEGLFKHIDEKKYGN